MMYNPFSLKDKTILITGASSGIGRGIAIECSKMGANIILCARRIEALNKTLELLEIGQHYIVQADLSQQTEIAKVANTVGKIDGVVHSAGVLQICSLKHTNYEKLTSIFQINTIAPILLTSFLVKNKKIADGSSIVFISSISGVKIGNTGESNYGASKGAIEGFVKSAAVELAKKDIRVNTLVPGIVSTNLLDVATNLFSKEQLDILINEYPLRRFGTPKDIANAAIYLLSDASNWVTGTSLVIDGGFTLL